ncbi:hypothetical protein PVNG_05885 [Plasmodium vivax North Korean]|uniref:Uncharacterized protein n=1 Tax=Plasmodium vivax North Korean TaxID=1035514 RepID=A0A0J9TMY5_PLAVI|nr:hypothetical protein PVNG_05885 [Plasmodium vivax North Korean]
MSHKNIQETVYTDIVRQKRLLRTNGNERGNIQIEFNKDAPDSVKNIKNQEQCSFKNNRKSPVAHKGDENKYREKEKCEMNNTNEFKPVYEHIENDTREKDKSSKNKNKNKPFLFKLFYAIDSYFEKIIFNGFSSIDKFRNNKSSNKFILAMIALTKISLVFAIPISFIVMACHMALNLFGGSGSVDENNYLYIVFISIGTIMIIYLLIKVLKYSCSKKKGSAI